jgi:hypothetical protein
MERTLARKEEQRRAVGFAISAQAPTKKLAGQPFFPFDWELAALSGSVPWCGQQATLFSFDWEPGSLVWKYPVVWRISYSRAASWTYTANQTVERNFADVDISTCQIPSPLY